MATEPPKQKRKRGRPPGASNADEDASPRDSQSRRREEQDVEEEARPRKRGRPRKSQDDLPKVSEKRPRKGMDQEGNTERENEEAEQPLQGARKRGRPLKESAVGTSNKMRKNTSGPTEEEEAQDEEDVPSSGLRRSNRERRSWNAEEIFSAKIPAKQPDIERETPSQARKRKRAAKGDADAEPVSKAPDASAAKPKKNRGRPSVSAEGVNARAPPKRRERPSASEPQEPGEEQPSQPRRRGRPRASDASEQGAEPSESHKAPRRKPRRSSGEAAQPSKPRARKARSSLPEPAAEGEDAEEAPAFRHLASQERKVSRKVIDTKWAPLQPSAIAAISALLADAQRPVLLRLPDNRNRREHASSALALVSRRLRSKLAKGMPFPPPTATTTAANRSAAEDDFDFERTVDSIQALENTLNPLLHSIALLEREKAKEEAALDKDTENLSILEANARAERRSFRERSKRDHPLAPPIKKAGERETLEDQPLELVKSEGGGSGRAFEDLQGEELITLSKQIGSHMDSMRGNLQQIDGVIPAITKSKAALQRVLQENLEVTQYEQVLLG